MEGTLVNLQVGEQRFTTTTRILQGSQLFASLVEDWENAKPDDRTSFIDADPHIFAHILRYLRHGVLPVFYDRLKGHDFPLYQAVLRQAEDFKIPRLERWLKDKTYLKAVKIDYSAEWITGQSAVTVTKTADTVVEYLPAVKTKRIYVCPREIPVHRGNRNACGQQCRKVQGDRDDMYEDELVLTTLAINKETRFDEGLCVAED